MVAHGGGAGLGRCRESKALGEKPRAFDVNVDFRARHHLLILVPIVFVPAASRSIGRNPVSFVGERGCK